MRQEACQACRCIRLQKPGRLHIGEEPGESTHLGVGIGVAVGVGVVARAMPRQSMKRAPLRMSASGTVTRLVTLSPRTSTMQFWQAQLTVALLLPLHALIPFDGQSPHLSSLVGTHQQLPSGTYLASSKALYEYPCHGGVLNPPPPHGAGTDVPYPCDSALSQHPDPEGHG